MRRRIALGALALLTLLVTVQVGTASGAVPYITRLRVELSGSSDWQGVQIPNAWLALIRVESISSGARLSQTRDSITLVGSSTASAVVSMIVEAPTSTSDFTIELQKGRTGTAHTRITRNNTAAQVIADFYNQSSTGDYTTYDSVTRAQLVGEGLTIPRMDSRRLVLAFYYPWFRAGQFSSGPWYDEPVDAYDTETQSEVTKMVTQASQNGIDGFLVSWDNDHMGGFDRVMAAAKTRPGFSVAPLLELSAYRYSDGSYDLPGVKASITRALQRSSNAEYLKSASGKPVVFVFGVYDMGPTQWTQVVKDLAAAGKDAFYVGEAGELSYGFNGTYFYSPNNQPEQNLNDMYGTRSRNMRYPAMLNSAIPQRLWAATVSPGQNLSYFDMLHPRNEARDDGKRYDITWQAAWASTPEWILITSWNEWYEATHIQASKKFGYRALQQTANWASAFHNPQTAGGTTQTEPKPLIKLPLLVRN